MIEQALYYITRPLGDRDGDFELEADTLQQIDLACRAGIKWIQLRMKNINADQLVRIASAAVKVCRDNGAKLIINDNVDVALQSGADGVHLGQCDASPEYARSVLGAQAIIGSTVHNLVEARTAVDYPIDYIGLGPFRLTQTKSDLAPVLGFEGMVTIRRELLKLCPTLPVFAVGGIEFDDCESLFRAGFNGVAMSGAISKVNFNLSSSLTNRKESLWIV